MSCSSLLLVGLADEGEWPTRSVVKDYLTTDRDLCSYQVSDLCANYAQLIVELAGLELDPVLLALQPYAVETCAEEGPFPLPAVGWESWQQLCR